MERWHLLITETFLFWTFRRWQIWPFFQPKSWWKYDICLVFLSFSWYSRTWEIWFFVQCVDSRVWPHLMWHVELKTLDFFMCVPAHDLGHLSLVSPNCPNVKIPKNRYNLTLLRLLHLVKTWLDVKLKTLYYFLSISISE